MELTESTELAVASNDLLAGLDLVALMASWRRCSE